MLQRNPLGRAVPLPKANKASNRREDHLLGCILESLCQEGPNRAALRRNRWQRVVRPPQSIRKS